MLAVPLVQMLQQALTLDAWMSARAALTPWGWCPDQQAPTKLKRWLKVLSGTRFLNSTEVRDVEECFAIRQVTFCRCEHEYGLILSPA